MSLLLQTLQYQGSPTQSLRLWGDPVCIVKADVVSCTPGFYAGVVLQIDWAILYYLLHIILLAAGGVLETAMGLCSDFKHLKVKTLT